MPAGAGSEPTEQITHSGAPEKSSNKRCIPKHKADIVCRATCLGQSRYVTDSFDRVSALPAPESPIPYGRELCRSLARTRADLPVLGLG